MKRVITEMHMDGVAICYGMTETSPVSTQTRADDDLERRTATVGRVMPHVEVKVIDPSSGLVLPVGEAGELCTRGYSVMLGYWNEAEKTAEAIDPARWMHTGDLAVMRDDGYVNIVGRIKDLVIRGGENIYPREVEEFLYTHPDIEDVAVIGVPDERYGEEIMAWIRLRPGAAALDAAALRSFCQGRIAHQKIPRYVRIADEFPMTVTGKVRKVEMREVSIVELGLEGAAAHRHGVSAGRGGGPPGRYWRGRGSSRVAAGGRFEPAVGGRGGRTRRTRPVRGLHRREPDGKDRARTAVAHLDAAVIGVAEVGHDGQAETEPAMFTIARLVQADEPLEDPLSLGRRHARAVVADLDGGGPGPWPVSPRRPGWRQTGERCRPDCRSPAPRIRPARARRPGCRRWSRPEDRVGGGGDHVPGHRQQIAGLLDRGQPAFVRTGQQKELLDQPGHPGVFHQHLVGHPGPVGGMRAMQRHLHGRPDVGDRRAQLVGRIGQKPPLAGRGGLQAVEHGVEGPGQPAHLVVGVRLGDAVLARAERPRPPPPGAATRSGAGPGRP